MKHFARIARGSSALGSSLFAALCLALAIAFTTSTHARAAGPAEFAVEGLDAQDVVTPVGGPQSVDTRPVAPQETSRTEADARDTAPGHAGPAETPESHAHESTTHTAVTPSRRAPWSEDVLDAFGSLPVQDGGRVKPMSTYAAFTLLRISGKRSAETAEGETLDPVAWLLDVLFHTDDALRARTFLVSDSDALVAAGLDVEGHKKRDRWSYEELQPCLPRLFALAHEYDAIAPKERTTVQRQVVDLAGNVMTFVRLARYLDFVRTGDPTWSNALAIVPPEPGTPAHGAWLTPADVIGRVTPETPIPAGHEAVLTSLSTMEAQRNSASSFGAALSSLRENVVSAASARGEYEHVELERNYYAANPLGWSLGAFLVAFLVCAISWVRPRGAALRRVAMALVGTGTALLVAAIVVRCVIRGRPPVTTLYETVIFTTACAAILALFLEFVHRSRTAVSAAAVLGTIGLFVATGYETLDKQDTMPSLVAVLDTNFWLATHVTAITVGYAAGMLAALLGSAYLILTTFGWKRSEPGARRELARMTYGVLCFAVIFATVGTILGGIWANESWGRFWGWDPKENGALLIVISQVVILHARRGGYLRDHGTCAAAAFGGTIIAFSWWGVNLLGVGLHSYGFTSGIHSALWTYYGVQWGIVGVGGIGWWLERRRAKKVPTAQIEPSSKPARGRRVAA